MHIFLSPLQGPRLLPVTLSQLFLTWEIRPILGASSFFAVTRFSREGAGQSDILAGSMLCSRPDVLDLLRIMCL